MLGKTWAWVVIGILTLPHTGPEPLQRKLDSQQL